MERISIKSEQPPGSKMVSGYHEEGFVESEGACTGNGGGRDWLLDIVMEMNNNRELNDIVPVCTTVNHPQPNLLDDDDDDCVILDGDPEQMNMVGTVSDEVEVVGTRGEVACRDFPHSRHLCANYIFGSTPHEIHCRMCHCYVCDSPAPCVEWGTGMLVFDHCHATDKEDYWKIERDMHKNVVEAATASSILVNSNDPRTQQQTNRVHPGYALQQSHRHRFAIQSQVGRITPLLCQVNHGAVRPNLHNQNTLHQVYGGGLSFKRIGRASLPPMNHPYAHQSSHFASAMGVRAQIPQSFQHIMPSLLNTGQRYFLIPPQTQLNTAAASTSTTQPRIVNRRMFSPQLLGGNLPSLNPSFQQNMGNLGCPHRHSQENHQVITRWNGNNLESHFEGESSSAVPAIRPRNNLVLGIGSKIFYQVDP